jgi:hypothetical protein
MSMRTSLWFSVRIGVIAILLLGCDSWAAAQQNEEKIESRAIESLREKIAKDPHAVENFWEEMKRSGTPLAEPIASEPHYSFVTFVWRGDAETHNVVVVSPLALVNLEQAKMNQLPGTDVWYLTYRMRNDARMAYRLAPNDSLVPFEAETNFFARMAHFQRDPFNAKTFDYGGNMKASVLELSEAPPDEWIHARQDVPHGAIREAKLQSALLKNERSVWLYTPPAYDPAKTYPLLVVMDGEPYTTLVPTPTILDNLIHAGKIPAVVALFVGNASPEARDTELNCAAAWSDRFSGHEHVAWYATFSDGLMALLARQADAN